MIQTRNSTSSRCSSISRNPTSSRIFNSSRSSGEETFRERQTSSSSLEIFGNIVKYLCILRWEKSRDLEISSDGAKVSPGDTVGNKGWNTGG
ncbi:hypothetical protein K0M31_008413 [Melipona bicolor]|uniref:Uncharacterized protein n=1 Tax=Melipona bicolor TaxID=60889 RepID=A0AA40KKT0_9HYME|nr:hypothetical protein K0M31_008413 [Melipona bicolor]